MDYLTSDQDESSGKSLGKILYLYKMLMRLRQRLVPRGKRMRAPVIWIRQWLRMLKDKGQYRNLIAKLYQECGAEADHLFQTKRNARLVVGHY